jgi:ion channel-forming bestrophin family protein
MFCQEIIHVDIERLKRTPGPNVFLGSHHGEEHGADAGNPGSVGKQPETAH